MPDDYFKDADSEPDTMTRDAAESNSAHADETPPGNEDQPTALIPKAALMGKKVEPGDTVTFRAVRTMDDQVEFVCESEGEKSSEDEESSHDMPDGSKMADREMESLMS